MACPFFEPTGLLADSAWATPPRMPLGGTYNGVCRCGVESYTPPDNVLREYCNRGYARFGCNKFPAGADDALRFSVQPSEDGAPLQIRFIYERDYAPTRHGLLEHPSEEVLDGDAARAQLRMFVNAYSSRVAAAANTPDTLQPAALDILQIVSP